MRDDAKVLSQWKHDHPHCGVCVLRRPKRKIHPTVDRHHRRGHAGARFSDQKDWIPVCRDCHIHIHNNRRWAKENGLLDFRY